MSESGAAAPGTATVIVRNSLWYGVELASGLMASVVVSIAVGRIIGPVKLGYYNYIFWLTNIAGSLCSLGVPMTTRKYMAEYLTRDPAVARAVFFACFRLQAIFSLALTLAGVVAVVFLGERDYLVSSLFLVSSLLPRMMAFIPSQANMARENTAANVPGSVVGTAVYLAGAGLSLILGWGLVGLAASVLLWNIVEFTIKTIPVVRWMRSLPHGSLPADMKAQMRTYSFQGTLLLLLNIVVWDRSDIILLKAFNSDIRQITFFSFAFTLTERLLIAPGTFAQATGISVMAQYGRDRRRLAGMVSESAKYIALFACPLLLGAAALSKTVIPLLYGPRYLPVIGVFAVASAFGIGKALLPPAQSMLQATRNQGFLIWWGICCGIVNIAIDVWLIPTRGALGAAIGNGTAQALCAAGIWFRVWRLFDLKLDVVALAKIFGCSAAMMLAVRALVARIPHPVAALACGVVAGAVFFLVALRLLRPLGSSDQDRLLQLKRILPARVRPLYWRLAQFVTP
jgi:O-antigen/teichoic acid export membrane protein